MAPLLLALQTGKVFDVKDLRLQSCWLAKAIALQSSNHSLSYSLIQRVRRSVA